MQKLIEKKDTTYIDNVEIKEIPVPAELNWWQRWQIRSFWWLFGAVAIVVGWQIIKLYFRLKKQVVFHSIQCVEGVGCEVRTLFCA